MKMSTVFDLASGDPGFENQQLRRVPGQSERCRTMLKQGYSQHW